MKSILLSATLFGSVYLFGTALRALNKHTQANNGITRAEVVNVGVMMVTGAVLLAAARKAYS